MGGNWIACSEGARRRATHHSPIGFSESVAWKAISKRWMPRVCALIHVESTSRSRSHPLQCFSGAAWWLLNGAAFGGPAHLWGSDQSLPHLEILRTVTEKRGGRDGGVWERGIRWTTAVRFCKAGLRNALGQRCDVNVICYQHVQTECADEVNNGHTHTHTHAFTDSGPVGICIPCKCEYNTLLYRSPHMLHVMCFLDWHSDTLNFPLISCCRISYFLLICTFCKYVSLCLGLISQ